MLVTGGTGFTGSHTAAALAAAGHQVRLMVRDPAKVGQVFPLRGYSPDDVVAADMTDGDAVEAAFDGCHGVIHTAAVVDLRRRSARAVEEANTRGVEIVVGGAVRRGIPSIVHVSSLSVFLVRNGPPMSASSPSSTAHRPTPGRRPPQNGMFAGCRTPAHPWASAIPPAS